MSKHLRFGRLLSLLAIMLTMSFAWAQGQNLSSEKVLSHFKFTDTGNAALYGDVVGTVNEVTKVVTVVLPYRYTTGQPEAIGSTSLTASFKSSKFSNVFFDQAAATDLMIGSAWRTTHAMGQGYGTETNAPWILSGAAYPFADGSVLTVEAENHSYVYYTLAISFGDPSTLSTLTAMAGSWAKGWATTCATSTATGAATITTAGTAITVNVPFGTTNLAAFPLTFTIDPFAKAFFGDPAPGTAILPAAGTNLALPIPISFNADLSDLANGLTIRVYPQAYPTDGAAVPTVYTIKAVVGIPSELDGLLTFALGSPAVGVPIATLTQTLSATVPFSAASIVATFTNDKYSRVFSTNPLLGGAVELCSPYTLTTVGTGPFTFYFWVQAEDPSEVSEYVLTLTRAACSTANDLLTITADYWKNDACHVQTEGPSLTGVVTGTISEADGTVNFDVPYGTTSLRIKTRTISALAKNASVGLYKALTGDTVLVTSECGVGNSYAVTITPGVVSEDKKLLSFGFHADHNAALGFNWNGVDYYVEEGDADFDQVLKRVIVRVPFVTDLHHLVAFFTHSDYACVSIANTSGNVPQTSDVSINDFSNTLTYIVTAENGTQERYEVRVIKDEVSTDKSFTDFTLTGLPYCEGLFINRLDGGIYDIALTHFYDVFGDLVTVSGTNVSISVKAGTDVTDLHFEFELGTILATVAISNGTITKDPFDATVTGHANFTNPVTITVTAENFSQTVYTITVVPRPVNSDKVLTSYWFLKSTTNPIGSNDAIGVIDQATRVVTVHVPFGSDVSELAAGFILNNGVNDFPGGAVMTHSEDLQYVQESDVTRNDFSHQVAYTIFGEDCSTLEYFVNVIVDDNGANDILTMTLTGVEMPNCKTCEDPAVVTETAVITGDAIEISVPFGTDLHNLHLVGGLSPDATVSPLLSEITEYVGPITLTVTAANGVSTKTYTLTIVTEAALTGTQLLTFGFEKVNNLTFDVDRWTVLPINHSTYRIDVKVPFGTDLTALVATFTHSPMSCVYINGVQWTAADLQCSGVDANDFTDALTYTVKAQNGDEAYYNVYVTMDTPLDLKSLTGFSLNNIPYCELLKIDPPHYSIPVTGTTAFNISVKAGTNLAIVMYSFTVSPTATVTASNGTLVKVGDQVTGTANFTNPVTFTVTAQNSTTLVYTVSVTPRAVNSMKQLTKYWFKGAPVNPIGGFDVQGTINETAKTVDIWVPWGTTVTSLVANFELNNLASTLPGGVILTHSEDVQFIQTSGVSANNFSTPVAYTVIAEDCSTVEYFVTVRMIPNTDTGISGFTFDYTDCGCNLSTRIDPYARRIYISVPSTVNIASLAPASITITPAIGTRPAASISPGVGVAQNWTNGPIKYTVTAPDGVTKVDWMVYVTNPKCKDTNILAFSLPGTQVTEADLVPGFGQPVVIDTVNHRIDVIIKKGINLASVYYERELPCGATICCVGGNCQDNHYLDFSQGGCHTCVVTAQDQTVTQEWTICVHEIDVAIPTVKTWSVMAYNCTDSVAVQSNELGRVFIVNENAIYMNADPLKCTPMYNLFDWTGDGAKSVAKLVADRMGAWATVTAVDTPVYIQTNGLYSGIYWAFSVDMSGKVSCISAEKLFLDICDVTVATLCDLRNQPDVWRYTLSQEVFVSHEEARSTGGNWKFVQSADCGILIEDRVNALPATYGVGAGLTNLKGMLDKSGITLKLIPVCCYTPTKSSSGNVIVPKLLTWDEYLSQCFNGKAYESMLVKVTTPMKVDNDYGQGPNWMFDGLDLHTINATGGSNYFIQSVFNSPLIGTAIPTVPAYYQGIRTNVQWTNVQGLFTPRSAADITLVTEPVMTGVPNPGVISGVFPGQCKSINIRIYNEGVGNANITALYLDDIAATDEFQIVPSSSVTVPFTVGTWAYKTVEVKFCPLDAGSETTNLIVEYGVGKTLVIPINGSTQLIFDLPYYQNFDYTAGPPELWVNGASLVTYADKTGWSSPTYLAAQGANDVVFAYSNWPTPHGGFYTNNRSFGMRPRKVAGAAGTDPYSKPVSVITPGFRLSGANPVVSWYETSWQALHDPASLVRIPNNDARNVWVSKDKTNWTMLRSYTANDMPYSWGYDVRSEWRKMEINLYEAGFAAGDVVFFNFDLQIVPGDNNAHYEYWIIDDFAVEQKIDKPIISVSPNPGDFGGVQVDATGTLNFEVKNIGVSILKIKSVVVTGTGFTKTDTNTYPFEITDGPGTWAYTIGATGSVLSFSVDFKPTEIGVKTGKVTITYGLYTDEVLEIPLTGEGLSCATAAVAVKGRNWAPSQNTWWKYTADKFSIVQITSCDVHQALAVAGEYSWDTFLYVYSDCAGTLIASNDDMEAACTYNRASSSVQTVVNSGETIMIFFPLAFPTSLHAYEGFYFNINVTYPVDGDVCENAIPLTLPVVNHFGTTVGFNDDYNISPCSPFSNYMDGNDKVYSITIPYEGYLTASILGAYGSVHVLDVCPTVELEKFHCKLFIGGPNGGTQEKKIAAGTYFVIISTWAPPQTVDFLLNMSFRGTGVEDNALNSKLSVYPNPNSGKFTVSISNPEATDMTLELVNISGQVVYRNEVKAAYSYNEDIDASAFAKGVYYLKVNDAKGVKIEKVVIQ